MEYCDSFTSVYVFMAVMDIGPARTPPQPPHPWSQKRSRYLVTSKMTYNRPFWGALSSYMFMGGGRGVMQQNT